MEGATGTGKHKRRRGIEKEEQHQMQRTTHTRPKREVAERREGGREQTSTPHMKTIGTLRIGGGNYSTATTEGEGTEGDEPGYNPTPEDLLPW